MDRRGADLLRSGVGPADELTALGIGVVADLPVDLRFTPLFDELQRRAAAVFVHPNPSPDLSAHSLGLPDTLIDFTADTTRAIAQLQYSNTVARTPTSSTSSPTPEVPMLRMLREVVGMDHVVFGTDYPYLRRDLAVSCREHIEATPELTDGERTAALGATATTLIPRLATLRPRTRTRALSRDRDILGLTAQIALLSLQPNLLLIPGTSS